MLDSIRSSAQSFGVKIAFGIIILVFVFWGIGNFNDRDYSNVVAVVNGEPILASEFEKAYQNAEEYIIRNNPGVTREELIKRHLGRQVLQELIQAALLDQEAARAGMEITPVELRRAVGEIGVFQDENGKFDPNIYQRVLDARRTTPAQYEKEIGEQLLRDKLYALVTAPAWIEDTEPLNRFNFLREKRIIDYLFIPEADFLQKAEVTPKEIEEWYGAHQNDFAIPAKVDVSYIMVRPESLVDPQSITVEDAEAWYETNKSQFDIPEQAEVSHILIMVPEDADEAAQKAALEQVAKAQAELASGKSFAEVADAFNQEGAADKGGKLGWISRGQTVEPFENAAFAAEKGKVTDPVRSPFGWHLILVEDKKEAHTKTFEEVETEARTAIAAERGADKIADVLDNLIEDNILQKPLNESAEKFGLKAEQTGLMELSELAGKLGAKEADLRALMATSPGSPLDTAIEAGDNYIIARVETSQPSSIKPLKDVENEITNSIKKEKALADALAQAAKDLAKFREDNNPQSLPANIVKGKPMERGGSIAGFAPNTELSNAIFETKVGQWLERPYSVSEDGKPGALIARVSEIVKPDKAEYEQVAEVLDKAAKQERMDALFSLVLQRLGETAKIEITNQRIIDRGES